MNSDGVTLTVEGEQFVSEEATITEFLVGDEPITEKPPADDDNNTVIIVVVIVVVVVAIIAIATAVYVSTFEYGYFLINLTNCF